MLEELVVDDYGVSLHKKSERIIVKKNGQVIAEHAIKLLNDLVIGERCGMISVDLLHHLIGQGTQVHFINNRQEPCITLYTPAHHGTTKTRREQLTSYLDERGVKLCQAFAQGKIHNQLNTLKYYLRSRGEEEKVALQEQISSMQHYWQKAKTIEGSKVEDVQAQLRSIEAHAAKHYWQGVCILLTGKYLFPGREKRGSQDPANMLFNYSYRLLETRVSGAIIKAGLDPYAGFMHNDRSGKASLVYDLIEEFRQPIVDRVILSLLSRGYQPKTEQQADGTILLDQATRGHVRELIFKRLDQREAYSGKQFCLKTIIQLQARALATFFREGKVYKPFIARW